MNSFMCGMVAWFSNGALSSFVCLLLLMLLFLFPLMTLASYPKFCALRSLISILIHLLARITLLFPLCLPLVLAGSIVLLQVVSSILRLFLLQLSFSGSMVNFCRVLPITVGLVCAVLRGLHPESSACAQPQSSLDKTRNHRNSCVETSSCVCSVRYLPCRPLPQKLLPILEVRYLCSFLTAPCWDHTQ